MEISAVLKGAGLAGNEVKVYLSLLDLGSAKAGEITKQSGVNRTNVYDSLDRLMEKGLVSFVIQSNRKYFEAAPVERMAEYLKEEQKELQKKAEAILAISEELDERRTLGREPQEATIYKGRKGLKSVAEQVLKEKELLVFGAEGQFVSLFTFYAENWHRRRGKLGIPIRIIFHENLREKKTKSKFPKATLRFTEVHETPATTWIFGDKVAIIVWSEQPLATVIRSRDVAKSYKSFFQVLWKEAKKKDMFSEKPNASP